MVGAAQVDDHGARALYPFCLWPRAAGPRGKSKAKIEIAFARNGDPDDIVEMVPTSTKAGAGHRVRVVDPLSWYAARKPKFLPAILIAAGRQFQVEYEWLAVHRGPHVLDYGRPVVSQSGTPGAPSLIDALVARGQRMETALDFVGGPELDRILVHLVGQSRPVLEFERRHAYPAGSGLATLRTALYRLALSYEMISPSWRP